MTDLQLYILIGIPLVALLSNTALYIHLSSRVTSLEARMDSRILSLESHMDARFNSMETRLDLILGKVTDLDTRVSVLEDRSARGGQL